MLPKLDCGAHVNKWGDVLLRFLPCCVVAVPKLSLLPHEKCNLLFIPCISIRKDSKSSYDGYRYGTYVFRLIIYNASGTVLQYYCSTGIQNICSVGFFSVLGIPMSPIY